MNSKIFEEFTIRRIEDSDLVEVVKLSNDNGFSNWKEDDYQKFVDSDDSIALVVCAKNKFAGNAEKLIGFLIVRLLGIEGEILTFAVEENFRRQGIASKLIGRLIIEAKLVGVENLFLEVRESNLSAIKFYSAKGFKKIGQRPSYYSNPSESAVLMVLNCISR